MVHIDLLPPSGTSAVLNVGDVVTEAGVTIPDVHLSFHAAKKNQQRQP